jgi:hypothetical protein
METPLVTIPRVTRKKRANPGYKIFTGSGIIGFRKRRSTQINCKQILLRVIACAQTCSECSLDNALFALSRLSTINVLCAIGFFSYGNAVGDDTPGYAQKTR